MVIWQISTLALYHNSLLIIYVCECLQSDSFAGRILIFENSFLKHRKAQFYDHVPIGWKLLLRTNPKSEQPVSHRDWLALSAFPLCVYTSLFGKDWRTAHLPSTAHTHTHTLGERKREGRTERQSLVTLLLRDLPLPRGAEGTDLLPTLLNEINQDERREWMDRINEWRASSGTRLMGFVFHWHRACLTGRF